MQQIGPIQENLLQRAKTWVSGMHRSLFYDFATILVYYLSPVSRFPEKWMTNALYLAIQFF